MQFIFYSSSHKVQYKKWFFN